MKNLHTFIALPATLLSVIAAHAQELRWPYNLPRTVKYYPEDQAHVKRELAAQERLAWRAPMGVKKMGEDEGEKFWLGYWDLRGMRHDIDPDVLLAPTDDEVVVNATILPWLPPAIAPHTSVYEGYGYGHIRRMIFETRDFQCPGGTYSCSSIGHDDLCCYSTDTCVSTSEGVGCCPRGAACGQEVSSCDTEAGYTSCPNSPNGGCCIPGASCEGTGCVVQGTQTVTRTLNTATQTTGASFTTETSSGRTITVVYPTTEISVSTKTITLSPSGEMSTRTVTFSGEACQTGFFSCPANLGGGCCPTGQGCANDGTCPDTSSTATAGAPVLPTSESISPASIASSTTTTTVPANCPTGFYQCSAVYLGGCCRVGRNCQTTSCPPQDTTTVEGNPTIAVTGGSGAGGVDVGSSCANGWYGCGADQNGGCCPSNYACGVQSCSATVAGQRDTAKMAPSSATALRWAWGFMGFGVAVGVGMVWL